MEKCSFGIKARTQLHVRVYYTCLHSSGVLLPILWTARQSGGKASSPTSEGLGSIPTVPMGLFPGRVIPVTSKLVLQWVHCQAPGVIRAMLELVGPVSVYCDWVI